MPILKEYEKKVIELLVDGVLSPAVLSSFMANAELVSYEFTGCVYFLTLSHPDLPEERIVCATPHAIGVGAGIDTGFVVFLESHELTLECYSWGSDAPETYRDQEIQIKIGHISGNGNLVW